MYTEKISIVKILITKFCFIIFLYDVTGNFFILKFVPEKNKT